MIAPTIPALFFCFAAMVLLLFVCALVLVIFHIALRPSRTPTGLHKCANMVQGLLLDRREWAGAQVWRLWFYGERTECWILFHVRRLHRSLSQFPRR